VRRYWKYLGYVLRHKWFVMKACFKAQMYWRGLVHDMSKFLPDEFIPYAKHFYNSDGTKKEKTRDKTGHYKLTSTGDPGFDFAWLLHQKRNRHHWQWWTLPEDIKGLKILEMSDKAVIEMLCDWWGASKAQRNTGNVVNWYEANKKKLQLHQNTRTQVEEILGVKKYAKKIRK